MRARPTAADETPTVGGPLVRADFDEMAAMEAACYGEELITPAEEAWRWYLAHPCTTVAAREQGEGLGGGGSSEERARGGAAYAAHSRAGSPARPMATRTFGTRGDGHDGITGPSDTVTAQTPGLEGAGRSDIATRSNPTAAQAFGLEGAGRSGITGLIDPIAVPMPGVEGTGYGCVAMPSDPTTAHAFDPRGDGRDDTVGPSDPTAARTSGTEGAGGGGIAGHSGPIAARTPESPGTARGRIAGFVNLFPVRPAVFEALRAGTFNDADLVADDVEPDPAQAGGMLLSCIVVNPAWRGRGLAYCLLAAAAAQYPDVPADMGAVVDTATPAGAGLARKLGFSPLGPSDHGTAVWQRDWAGFVRAVEDLARGGGRFTGQGSAAPPE